MSQYSVLLVVAGAELLGNIRIPGIGSMNLGKQLRQSRSPEGFFHSDSNSILELLSRDPGPFLVWLESLSDQEEFYPASVDENLLAKFLRTTFPQSFERCHGYCAVVGGTTYEFGYYWPGLISLVEDRLGVAPSDTHRPARVEAVRSRLVKVLQEYVWALN